MYNERYVRSLPRPFAVFIIALAVFTVWITWRAKMLEIGETSTPSTPVLVGQIAPDFQLTTLDGRNVSLSDYRGKKKVVISFWASWCGPCRIEMPELRKFYDSTHKDDASYEFLAISIDEERAAAATAVKEDKLPFPVLMDIGGKTATAYHVDAIPTLLVIDEQGKVAEGYTGLQPAMEIQLAGNLGIKNYTPQFGGQNDAAGH